MNLKRMTLKRTVAIVVLAVTAAASLGSGWLAHHSYAEQSREFISAPPSAQFCAKIWG